MVCCLPSTFYIVLCLYTLVHCGVCLYTLVHCGVCLYALVHCGVCLYACLPWTGQCQGTCMYVSICVGLQQYRHQVCTRVLLLCVWLYLQNSSESKPVVFSLNLRLTADVYLFQVITPVNVYVISPAQE